MWICIISLKSYVINKIIAAATERITEEYTVSQQTHDSVCKQEKNREFIFKKRNKAYLLRWNMKMKRSSNKLNYTKLKSYKILKIKKSINYKLKLSAFMKIHSIFHIYLLKFADLNTSIQTESSEIDSKNQNIKYKVKNILNWQNIKDQSHWLVKWKNYEHIENCHDSSLVRLNLLVLSDLFSLCHLD